MKPIIDLSEILSFSWQCRCWWARRFFQVDCNPFPRSLSHLSVVSNDAQWCLRNASRNIPWFHSRLSETDYSTDYFLLGSWWQLELGHQKVFEAVHWCFVLSEATWAGVWIRADPIFELHESLSNDSFSANLYIVVRKVRTANSVE